MADEQVKAQSATSNPEEESIFTKIINGKIPCKKVYEDEKVSINLAQMLENT